MDANITIDDVLPHFKAKAYPWQYAGVNDAIAALKNGESEYSWGVPPRCGKTNMIRAAAMYFRAAGIASYVFHIVPQTWLRDQATEEKDLRKFEQLFRTKPFYADQIEKLPEEFEPDPRALVVATTIQLFVGDRRGEENDLEKVGHRANMIKLIKQVRQAGKIVVIMADEAQFCAQANASGKTLEAFRNAGAFVVTMSGSWCRSDNERIFGSITERVKSVTVFKHKVSEGSAPNKSLVKTFEDKEGVFSHRPQLDIGLKRAWREGKLAKLGVDFVDLSGITIEGEKVTEIDLRTMTENQVRRHLWKIVRDPKVIKEGVRMMLAKLKPYRRKNNRIQAIIFCGNDRGEDQSDNDHCNNVFKELCRQAPDLEQQTRIVTGTDKKARENMQAFRDGDFSVLIVKQMGGVGLDVPTLKVLLDLSTVRTEAASIQRLLRVATKGEDAWVGETILVGDVFSVNNFATIITSNGGGYQTNEIEESKKIDEYEVDKRAHEKESFFIEQAEFGWSTDNEMTSILELEEHEKIARLFEKHPEWQGRYTFAEIAKILRAGETTDYERAEDATGDRDIRRSKKAKRLAINDLILKITQFDAPYKQVPDDVYRAALKKTWHQLRSSCGIKQDIELSQIQDEQDLNRLLEAATVWLRERRSHG
jgi:hypothetical protein